MGRLDEHRTLIKVSSRIQMALIIHSLHFFRDNCLRWPMRPHYTMFPLRLLAINQVEMSAMCLPASVQQMI